jgi:hypothetical protein
MMAIDLTDEGGEVAVPTGPDSYDLVDSDTEVAVDDGPDGACDACGQEQCPGCLRCKAGSARATACDTCMCHAGGPGTAETPQQKAARHAEQATRDRELQRRAIEASRLEYERSQQQVRAGTNDGFSDADLQAAIRASQQPGTKREREVEEPSAAGPAPAAGSARDNARAERRQAMQGAGAAATSVPAATEMVGVAVAPTGRAAAATAAERRLQAAQASVEVSAVVEPAAAQAASPAAATAAPLADAAEVGQLRDELKSVRLQLAQERQQRERETQETLERQTQTYREALQTHRRHFQGAQAKAVPLKLRRERLLESACDRFLKIPKKSLVCSDIYIEFHNELGVDEGGPLHDFWSAIGDVSEWSTLFAPLEAGAQVQALLPRVDRQDVSSCAPTPHVLRQVRNASNVISLLPSRVSVALLTLR